MKKAIRKKKYSLGLYDIDGETVESVIKDLEKYKHCKFDYDYDGGWIDIVEEREETDEEYQERLRIEKEHSEAYLRHQEKLERAELERLKKKYENR